MLEGGEPPLELQMGLHGAGDRAHRAGARPQTFRCLRRCPVQPGVRGEAQVVVGGEVDDLSPVEARPRPGHPLERARMQQQAGGLERHDLIREVVQRVGHTRTLPRACSGG